MKIFLTIISLFTFTLLLAAPSFAQTTTYTLSSGYSGTQGTNNWYYYFRSGTNNPQPASYGQAQMCMGLCSAGQIYNGQNWFGAPDNNYWNAGFNTWMAVDPTLNTAGDNEDVIIYWKALAAGSAAVTVTEQRIEGSGKGDGFIFGIGYVGSVGQWITPTTLDVPSTDLSKKTLTLTQQMLGNGDAISYYKDAKTLTYGDASSYTISIAFTPAVQPTPTPTLTTITPTPTPIPPTPTPTLTPTPTPVLTHPPGVPNLLTNGDFENQIDGNWWCGGAVSGSCVADSVTKYAGNYSAKVINTGPGPTDSSDWGWQVSQGNITAAANEDFCLSARVKKQNANDWTFIAIQETASPWRQVTIWPQNHTQWQQVLGTLRRPADWTTPTIQVYLRQRHSSSVWFDDVVLTRGACVTSSPTQTPAPTTIPTSTPTTSSSSASTTIIDTLNYFLSDHPEKGLTGSHPLSQEIDQNLKRMYLSKWQDPGDPAGFTSRFEVLTWDDQNIYLKEDHSSAPVPFYSFNPGTWMKRQMAVGDKVSTLTNQIQVYDSACKPVPQLTPLTTGTFPIELTLERREPSFNIYTYLGQAQPTTSDYISSNQDVIVGKYDSSVGNPSGIYENFYLSKEWGLILWEDRSKTDGSVRNRSYFTQIQASPLKPLKSAICTPELKVEKQALFGVVPACTITVASWSTPLGVNPVDEGTNTNLNVQTSGNCTGKQMEFKIWEDDGILGGDSVRINPSPSAITSNSATATWVAEYQCDGLNCINDPPEYYFEVNIVGGSTKVRSAEPKLVVNKAAPPPQPTPTPTPTPKPLVISHSPQNPTTLDTITFSAAGYSPSGVKNIYMYAAGVTLTPTCTSTTTTMICTATYRFTTYIGQVGYAVDMFDNAGKLFSQAEIFQVTQPTAATPTPIPTITPTPRPSPISTPTPAPKAPPCDGFGDVNLDNVISQDDITWISDQIAGRRSFTDEQKKKADVNGDNIISSLDTSKVSGYLTGNVATFDVCQPITITSVSISNILKDQATISWATSAPGTSKVIYGISRTTLNQSVEDLLYKTSPSITLTNLQPSRLYFYKVQSENGAGLVTSALGVFRTKAQ